MNLLPKGFQTMSRKERTAVLDVVGKIYDQLKEMNKMSDNGPGIQYKNECLIILGSDCEWKSANEITDRLSSKYFTEADPKIKRELKVKVSATLHQLNKSNVVTREKNENGFYQYLLNECETKLKPEEI